MNEWQMTAVYALVVVLAVVEILRLLVPGLIGSLKAQTEAAFQRVKNNSPEGRRELLEWAAKTAYEGVEQAKRTELFKKAYEAVDNVDWQTFVKEEAKKRALALVRVSGVRVGDESVVLAVLDTLLEQMIYREKQTG